MKPYSNVLEDLTTKAYVIMKLLDFSPAFGTVDHNIRRSITLIWGFLMAQYFYLFYTRYKLKMLKK